MGPGIVHGDLVQVPMMGQRHIGKMPGGGMPGAGRSSMGAVRGEGSGRRGVEGRGPGPGAASCGRSAGGPTAWQHGVWMRRGALMRGERRDRSGGSGLFAVELVGLAALVPRLADVLFDLPLQAVHDLVGHVHEAIAVAFGEVGAGRGHQPGA